MRARIVASMALAFAVAACEQESQPLPFSADGEAVIVRTITPSESAVVTSSAGVSVQFPAGSVSEATEISIRPAAPPAGIAASGSPVSRGFQITPDALMLNEPALVELRIDRNIESAHAWLASLVVVTSDGVEEIGNTRLDLRAGLAEAEINRLGTLAMVIPEPDAVFITRPGDVQASLSPAARTFLPIGTDSVVANCGGRGARCEGTTVAISDDLGDKVSQVAAIYPQLSGSLAIHGESARGEITLSTSVRVLLLSGATSENVEVRGLLSPTPATVVTEDASSITLSNVLVRVTGGVGNEAGSSEDIRTVVIEKGDGVGFATFSRTFELYDENDQLEDATLSITFPVSIHQ